MTPNKPSDLWKRVTMGSPDECWPYKGSTFGGRYGRFFLKGRSILAHRVAYTLTFGEPAVGLFVMHKCNNKRCCNPRHLTTGTNSENQRHASTSGAFAVGVSGIQGVGYIASRRYWRAQGYLNGKLKNLYTGPDRGKAINARQRWEEETGINFGLERIGSE